MCRYTIDDAREDILEDLAVGMRIALERKNYFTAASIGGAMDFARTLDPIDEYGEKYANISTVSYLDRTWHIETCNNAMCTAIDREGDDW